MTDLTKESLDLLLSLARRAGDWAGTPLFEGSKAQQGNLTQLKKLGLVTSFDDDHGRVPVVFVEFTDAGVDLARKHGVEVGGIS